MAYTIRLEGEITLQNIEGLHEKLLAASKESGPVIIFCHHLAYLDTAAFQLLLSFKKSFTNHSITFEAVPPALLESARLLGLHSFLKMED
jgi:anti-anti-sigma regulatory factor